MARKPKPIVVVAKPEPPVNLATSTLLRDSVFNVIASLGLLAQPAVNDTSPRRGGTKHFVIAASGKYEWRPGGDRILRKIMSDTAQWALTRNGLTYTQLLALTAPSQLEGSQIIAYSNVAVQDNLNVFIRDGELLTLSVSNAGTQRITLHWDYVSST